MENNLFFMKHLIAFLFLFLIVAPMTEAQSAAPELGGSLRVRFESKKNVQFNEADQEGKINDDDYVLTRLRLNIKWQVTTWLSIFLEGQDARASYEKGFDDRKTPNTFTDAFDLHQGYFDLKFKGGKYSHRIRIGRQKFNMGALRLIASLEWENTARVWDGIRVTVGELDGRRIDLFSSRLLAIDPSAPNDWAKTGSRLLNSDFHGVYFTGRQFDAYWLLRHESIANDAVQTVGSRFTKKSAALELDGEVAYQFGKFGGLDHRAYMLHFGGFYTLEAKADTKIGIAYNIASGDRDPNDGKHETFDNQYPLNRAYYGYMDFFSLQNVHNFEATFQTKLIKKLAFRIAYQGFWLVEEDNDAWYNANAEKVRSADGANVNPYVGSEIDITLKFLNSFVPVQIGYSRFFYGLYVTDTRTPSINPKDADFIYVMAKTVF